MPFAALQGRTKMILQGQSNLGNVDVVLVLRGIFGGSLQITLQLSWIQEGFKGGILQKHLNPIRVPFLGDSARILGVCPTVTPTFGL